MNRAFIFDLDGVIVDSEGVWQKYESKSLPDLIGNDVYKQLKDKIIGNSLSTIYKQAVKYGATISIKEFMDQYNQLAEQVYKRAKVTPGIKRLINKLKEKQFKLGMVTVSPPAWVDFALKNFKKDTFSCIVLGKKNIKPKPRPEGYLQAMKLLGSIPESTMILEDSKNGITAAKSSGAFTICLRQNLPKDYLPIGADMYVDTIYELIEKIEKL